MEGLIGKDDLGYPHFWKPLWMYMYISWMILHSKDHVMVMMISHQTEATNKSGWDIMASWHHDFIAIPDLARCDVVASRSQSAGNELVFKLPVDVNENLSVDSIVKLVDHVLTSQCLTCLHSTPGQVRMIEEATAWTRTACFSKFVIFIQGFGSISHVQPCEHFFQ